MGHGHCPYFKCDEAEEATSTRTWLFGECGPDASARREGDVGRGDARGDGVAKSRAELPYLPGGHRPDLSSLLSSVIKLAKSAVLLERIVGIPANSIFIILVD